MPPRARPPATYPDPVTNGPGGDLDVLADRRAVLGTVAAVVALLLVAGLVWTVTRASGEDSPVAATEATTAATPQATPEATPEATPAPRATERPQRRPREPELTVPPGLQTPEARTSARKAARAARAMSENPFEAHPWGSYTGPGDHAHPPYTQATGATRDMLGRIALTPKAMWFGAWMPNDQIAGRIAEYIENSQDGDPDALVQMTLFRLDPWYTDSCKRAPTAEQAASYRDWFDRVAATIGDTPTAIVLQPDLTFALCAPDGPEGVATSLVDYSAEVLSELPNTTVYLEAGASDWPHPGQGGVDSVLRYLIPAGIEHADGVALNSTHFAATEDEVRRVADLSQALAARGMPGKTGVINTSSNGNPFEFGTYRGSGENTIADNARVCTTPTPAPGDTCVQLGIPPTADVDAATWGLDAETRRLARQYVDAYLWFGRPWLFWQNSPYQVERALPLAQNWPYADEAGF